MDWILKSLNHNPFFIQNFARFNFLILSLDNFFQTYIVFIKLEIFSCRLHILLVEIFRATKPSGLNFEGLCESLLYKLH